MAIKPEGKPGGVDKTVQFNDHAAFGGDAGLTYDKIVQRLFAKRIRAGLDEPPEPGALDILIQANDTLTEGDQRYGLYILAQIDGSNPIASFYGLDFQAYLLDGSEAPANAFGVVAEMQKFAAGATNNSYGGFFRTSNLAGSIATMYGIYVTLGAGTESDVIGRMYGVFVDRNDNNAQHAESDYGVYIGNRHPDASEAYGLYIEDVYAVDTAQSIRTGAGIASFGDDAEFRHDYNGPILIDRTTATRYRLYVDGGVLSIEAV